MERLGYAQRKEFKAFALVGIEPQIGTLFVLQTIPTPEETKELARQFEQKRTGGRKIILACGETSPFMIPILGQVEGILSPESAVTPKGHSAEFTREEGKTLMLVGNDFWNETLSHHGQTVILDPNGNRLIINPQSLDTQILEQEVATLQEIHVIRNLISQGRHISLLSAIPEPINAKGKFSYFCRQEQRLTATGTNPWNVLREDVVTSEQLILGAWEPYAKAVPENVAVIFRSLDARSDEYPGSPISEEQNPQLGLHGPSLFGSFPHVLEAETRAVAQVKQANPEKKIVYLLPFVRSEDEVFVARDALDTSLKSLSLPKNAVELAVMWETPALPYMLDDLKRAQVSGGIWIGTKDLLMAFAMADRDNSGVQQYLKLADESGRLNRPFLQYLAEHIRKMIEAKFRVIMYALPEEVPIFASNLPEEVGFLISKGPVKQALKIQ